MCDVMLHWALIRSELCEVVSTHCSSSTRVMWAEVGKVTLKSNGDEALNDEFLLKSNGNEALNGGFP